LSTRKDLIAADLVIVTAVAIGLASLLTVVLSSAGFINEFVNYRRGGTGFNTTREFIAAIGIFLNWVDWDHLAAWCRRGDTFRLRTDNWLGSGGDSTLLLATWVFLASFLCTSLENISIRN
jgi:hypothetical protein